MLVKRTYKGTIEFTIEEGKKPVSVISFEEFPTEYTESFLDSMSILLKEGYKILGGLSIFGIDLSKKTP